MRSSRSIFIALMSASVMAAVGIQQADAFSQEGHMLTGAIAYEELRLKSPKTLGILVELMSQHPDRGSFEIALGHATGEDRTRRLLMEMARWPDDIRKSTYDHPTWHYASRPLIDAKSPPPNKIGDAAAGSAVEAFFLNISVARDSRAPSAERAVALCWVLHLVGDIHQPLHAADGYSATYPGGDHGGNTRYIIDPVTQKPISLHWYWDQAANRSGDAAPIRATELLTQYPRSAFPQLGGLADDFNVWARESYALARTTAYRSDLVTGADETHASALMVTYVTGSQRIAERQATLAGYRIADLLMPLPP
jgi:S1/P1 Nuclease